jgi:uncharacterized protein YmfQ (DUF2313 family)
MVGEISISYNTRSAADYSDILRQLLPRGAAWNFGTDSVLAGVLAGLAEEFARIDARGLDLLEEADPRTALEMLIDWERNAGLPDDCFGAPDNIPERQIAVAQRITGLGGQNRAYFIELAAQLGYLVTIDEFAPFEAGSLAGDLCYSEDWRFVWRVNVLPPETDLPEGQFLLSEFHAGSAAGEYLRGFGALDLECLIKRHAPAHTNVLFSYPIEPDALFWFNFTE